MRGGISDAELERLWRRPQPLAVKKMAGDMKTTPPREAAGLQER
jgi:hypothetical protein